MALFQIRECVFSIIFPCSMFMCVQIHISTPMFVYLVFSSLCSSLTKTHTRGCHQFFLAWSSFEFNHLGQGSVYSMCTQRFLHQSLPLCFANIYIHELTCSLRWISTVVHFYLLISVYYSGINPYQSHGRFHDKRQNCHTWIFVLSLLGCRWFVCVRSSKKRLDDATRVVANSRNFGKELSFGLPFCSRDFESRFLV